jgi:hypothetical protein
MTPETQRLIDLNDKQKKAFSKFISAVKACQKANVLFYQVLETIHGLNGDNIVGIHDGSPSVDYGKPTDRAHCLDDCSNPCVIVCDGWADDPHYVELEKSSKGGGE